MPAPIRTRRLKITMPGPMTIVDTIADEHYGDRARMAMAFAALLNEEARALEKDGVDVIQFDEPAFNVYMDDVKDWGIEALHRAIDGLACTTAVHICYGYGIKENIDWKGTLGSEWRQYEEIFPALAKSRVGQVSVEAKNSRVPLELIGLLEGKDVLLGVIDVASDRVETPEEIAALIEEATKFVPAARIQACTNCGMAPMRWEIAFAKLEALGKGAKLARERLGLSPLPRAALDRRLERIAHVPGEIDPGVLRHLGDEGVDERPPLRLGVDGGEMRVRQHRAHDRSGAAGIDKIVDDQDALALPASGFGHRVADRLQNRRVALVLVIVIGGDADGLDDADFKFA